MVSRDSALRAYLPSIEVTVPSVSFPLTTTVTPGSGVPSLSTTSPFTICCELTGSELKTSNTKIAKN